MSDDLVRTIAFVYQRRGATSMERSRLIATLAFELRWFAPDLAKKLVGRALNAGLLHQEGDDVRVTFDPASVTLPVNFRPREDTATEDAPVDVPSAKLADLAEARADDEAARERARLGDLVSLDVARLILAHRRGEDVRERAADLAKRTAPPSR